MAWIESHQALGLHPKTVELAERLHVSMPTAVGLLHYFWWWAVDYAPSGHIKRTQVPTMAGFCHYHGGTWKLWGALVGSGFVDILGDGPADGQIHDWFDYAGRLLQQREANRERMRNARRAQNSSAHGATNSADTVHRTRATNGAPHRSGLPDPTGPVNFSPVSQSVSQSRATRARTRARGDGGLRPLDDALPDEVRQRLRKPPLGKPLPPGPDGPTDRP